MTAAYSQITSILNEKIPNSALQLLPRGWKRVGHVAILTLPELLTPYRFLIGEAYLSLLKNVRTIAMKVGPAKGTYRTPQIEVIAGDPQTKTVHKELNCQFELDTAYLTFSSGNHYERKRMIDIIPKYSSIVDMFACVGNLSLPVAVHKHVQVVGIEINPLAYEYLTKNIIRNKIEKKYQAILGDNRDHTPSNFADHVIMGCWESDPTQISRSFSALKKDSGGWVHFHELIALNKKTDVKQRFTECLDKLSSSLELIQVYTRRVKEVAPSFFHIVSDLLFTPI